jgi:hypothetical protein
VKPHIFHRLIALALALAGGAAGVPRAAAGQDGPPPAVVEQLNRLGANLFSAAPRPADANEDLKPIHDADPGLAEAHQLLGIAYRAEGSTARLGGAGAVVGGAIGR